MVKRFLQITVVLVLAGGALAPLGAGPTEEENIEAVVAAVVEAYRTGDYATMGRYYAPEVTVVPSDFNPPITGWEKVAQRYQRAFANLAAAELIRENTLIRRKDKVAWVTYQWRFAGIIGDQPFGLQGHTTLVLEKRKKDWLIVHNHTSALPTPVEEGPVLAAPKPPARN